MPFKTSADRKAWRAQKRDHLRSYKQDQYTKSAERIRTKYETFKSRLDYLKREVGCVDCGTKEGRLDYDHVDPTTKLFEIAGAYTRSDEMVAAEISKCVVRCVGCHLKRHHKERAIAIDGYRREVFS